MNKPPVSPKASRRVLNQRGEKVDLCAYIAFGIQSTIPHILPKRVVLKGVTNPCALVLTVPSRSLSNETLFETAEPYFWPVDCILRDKVLHFRCKRSCDLKIVPPIGQDSEGFLLRNPGGLFPIQIAQIVRTYRNLNGTTRYLKI